MDEIEWEDVRDEVTRHLQALIRIDTTNPPGNETAAAEYLVATVRAAGIDAQVVESAPGRGNAIARLSAEQPSGRPFMLMGHTDVVSVERERWTRDPFGGDLADGCVWGRGALDMKGQVAAELTALLLLKRRGLPLNRDVVLAAFADEEAGGDHGAAWMWAHRRDLLDAEHAINEGGGWPVRIGDRRFYLCSSGEKGASRLRVTARGPAGHASVPLADTAMARMGEALTRLHAWEPPTVMTPVVRTMLEAMAPALGPAGEAGLRNLLADGSPSWETLSRLPMDEELRADLRATTRNTAVPTLIRGGHRINVIPSEVTFDVDGRILPGQDPEDWRRQVQAVVGDRVDVKLLSRESGIEADPASPLFDAIAATAAELDPDAAVVPYLVTGGTDASSLPGIKVYGFFPFLPTERVAQYVPLIHAHDERIAVDDLLYGARFLYEVTARFCGDRT